MRTIRLPALLLCLLALAGCGPRPQFWVPGLTLPPGSTIVKREKVKTDTSATVSGDVRGDPDNCIMVNFDCPLAWSAMVAHVDAELKPQGYTDDISRWVLSGNVSKKEEATARSLSCTWTKDNGRFQIELDNLVAKEAIGMEKMAGYGGGKYELGIIRLN